MEGIKQNLDGNSAGAGDIFSQLFGGGGGRPRGPRRTENIVRDYTVKLEDLYNGKIAKFRVTHKIICPACKGMGGSSGCEKRCDGCGGQGVRVRVIRRGNMIQQMQSHCSDCNGTGKIIDPTKRCKECQGRKVVPEAKVLEVHVEPGMKSGDKVVLSHAADEAPGMEAGDIVYVLKEAKHETFVRQGPDLIMDISVTLAEALCGFTRYVKHLDGRVLKVEIPKGKVVKDGHFFMIPNEGMPLRGNRTSHGSLFFRFTVKFPDMLDDATRQQLMKLLKYPEQPASNPDAYEFTLRETSGDLFGKSVHEPEYHSSNVGESEWVWVERV